MNESDRIWLDRPGENFAPKWSYTTTIHNARITPRPEKNRTCPAFFDHVSTIEWEHA